MVDIIIAMILVQFVVVGLAMCEEGTVRSDSIRHNLITVKPHI